MTTILTPVDAKKKAQKIIQQRTLFAAGAGLIPIPIVDEAAILGVQLVMLKDIAKTYNIEFKQEVVKSLVGSILGNVGTVGLIKFIPGLGSFLGGAAVAVAGAAATYAVGKVFMQHFSQGGTLLDFDPISSRAYFKEEFEKGQHFVNEKTNLTTQAIQEQAQPTKSVLIQESQSLQTEIQKLQQEILALKQLQESKKVSIDLYNLKIIEGIGKKTETTLKAAGIQTLTQLSKSKPDDIKAILDESAGNFNMTNPESWPEQATLAVNIEMEALKDLQDKLKGGRYE